MGDLPSPGGVRRERLIDVIKLLDWISASRPREKDFLCTGLTLTNRCIELWCESIKSDYFNERSKEEENLGYERIKNVIWQRDIQPHAIRCRALFEEVRSTFGDPHQKIHRKLRNTLDIQIIKEILTHIDAFLDETSESDKIICSRLRDNPDKVITDEIDEFFEHLIHKLETIRDRINVLTSELRMELKCPDV